MREKTGWSFSHDAVSTYFESANIETIDTAHPDMAESWHDVHLNSALNACVMPMDIWLDETLAPVVTPSDGDPVAADAADPNVQPTDDHHPVTQAIEDGFADVKTGNREDAPAAEDILPTVDPMQSVWMEWLAAVASNDPSAMALFIDRHPAQAAEWADQSLAICQEPEPAPFPIDPIEALGAGLAVCAFG